MANLQQTNKPYKFVECTKQTLDTFPITDGYVYFTDTEEIYIDKDGIRKPYGISTKEKKQIENNKNDILTKLDKNQGAENNGKILGINELGDVVPVVKPSGGGTGKLETLTFTGGATGKYDGTKPLTVDIPEGFTNDNKFEKIIDYTFSKEDESSNSTIFTFTSDKYPLMCKKKNLYVVFTGLADTWTKLSVNKKKVIQWNTNQYNMGYVLNINGIILSFQNSSPNNAYLGGTPCELYIDNNVTDRIAANDITSLQLESWQSFIKEGFKIEIWGW